MLCCSHGVEDAEEAAVHCLACDGHNAVVIAVQFSVP
jgi:hypothetical protein